MTTFRPVDPGAPEIEVRPDIVRGPKVFVGGVEVAAVRGRGRPYYPIRSTDGGDMPLTLHGAFLGLRARIGDREYPVERRLTFLELFLVVLPLALLTLEPPIGALAGAIGVMTSLVIMKSARPLGVRVLLALLVTVGGAILLVLLSNVR
jgi:hypothetical protein